MTYYSDDQHSGSRPIPLRLWVNIDCAHCTALLNIAESGQIEQCWRNFLPRPAQTILRRVMTARVHGITHENITTTRTARSTDEAGARLLCICIPAASEKERDVVSSQTKKQQCDFVLESSSPFWGRGETRNCKPWSRLRVDVTQCVSIKTSTFVFFYSISHRKIIRFAQKCQ